MKLNFFKKLETDKKKLFLFLGIFDIFLVYLLMDYNIYSSIPATLALAATFSFGLLFIFIPNYASVARMTKRGLQKLSEQVVPISDIPPAFLLLFDLVSGGIVYLIWAPYYPMFLVAAIPIIAVYFFGKLVKTRSSTRYYLLLLAAVVLTAAITSYAMGKVLHHIGWPGTDEVAFDLYAAQLARNGTSPYSVNMASVLDLYHMDQTTLANGGCTCSYFYPPLSFLPFLILPMLNITDLYAYAYATVLFSVFAVFLVYSMAKSNNALLSLLYVFLLFTFITRPGGAVKYLAVSVFLLLAYLARKKGYLQGTFLGLAAATHQLAWFAIPFFYLLTWMEQGRRELYKTAFLSIGVFLLVCMYFFLLSPQSMVSNIILSMTERPSLQGPTIVGALMNLNLQSDYVYLYSTLIMLLFYAVSLVLFYLYPKTLKPMPAVAPWALFFFTANNGSGYFLPFIPILLGMYYVDRSKLSDRMRDRGYIVSAILFFLLFAALLLLLLLYFHPTPQTKV